MFSYLITFCYIIVCVLLILAVLLQHYKSETPKGSTSYFGGSGNKNFLYQTTKYLIAAFFILAFLHTAVRYRTFQKETDSFPIPMATTKPITPNPVPINPNPVK